MTDPLILQILEMQNEQTAMLARVESKVDGLPALQAKVDELAQESRDQKTALRTLKWAGGFALSVFSLVVTYVTTFGASKP
jgi:hypothetical protein